MVKRLYRILTSWLPGSLRSRRAVRSIRKSGLFDSAFYLDRYPDVREAMHDPIRHYVYHGAAEGRDPHPQFDTEYYLGQNPDVSEAEWNPLEHFIAHGRCEGRKPSLGVAAREIAVSIGREPEGPIAPALPPSPEVVISLRALQAAEAGGASKGREAAAEDPIVVVVSHVCAYPPRQGNEYRILRYMRWLESRGYQVLFVCCPLPGEEVNERDLALAARELPNFIYCDRRGAVAVSLTEALEGIVAGLEGTKVLPLSEDEEHRCQTEVALSPGLAENERVFCPDALIRVLLYIDARLPEPTTYIPNYVLSTRYLPLLKESRLKILDTIDVFSSMQEKVSAFGVEDRLAISGGEERALLLRADVVMAIQHVEAQMLADLVPERRVIDVGIDFDTAPEEAVLLPTASEPQRVLLVASSNAMNIRGLKDFLTYSWPFVIREHPDAELLVGGAISEFVPEGTPNVIPLGYVDSLDGLYRHCRLVVNPTLAGTGLKIKTLECLAYWRPLVTWPTGVDGLSPELRKLCSVVTDHYEFYLEIAKALSGHPREAFVEEDRAKIRRCLAGIFVYRELEEVLGDFVSSGKFEEPDKGRCTQ